MTTETGAAGPLTDAELVEIEARALLDGIGYMETQGDASKIIVLWNDLAELRAALAADEEATT